jgi:ribonuclease BN (tRNA processing enzyme)
MLGSIRRVDNGLQLTPVGVGAAYCGPGEAQSCYLVRGDGSAVCVDLGAGALAALQVHVAPHDLDLIVITHRHADHIVDLLSLRIYMVFGPGRGYSIRVLGPPGLRDHLAAFGGDELWEPFVFEDLEPGCGTRTTGSLSMTYREVPHIAPTYAVRFDLGPASICLGADCCDNDALPELARDVDVLVCECSHGAGPAPADTIHLDAAQAAGIATRANASTLLLTHCPPMHDRDAALAVARRNFSGSVEWAAAA